MQIGGFVFLNSWEIVLRIFLALVMGGIIGLERELRNHPAGIKTHALVCIGAALASLVSLEMRYDVARLQQLVEHTAQTVDASRIAAGVLTGIGFIGTGAIIRSKDGAAVTGITTAANIWVTGCLGLAIGMGYYTMSVVTFLVVVISNVVLKKLETRYMAYGRERGFEFAIIHQRETMSYLEEYFEEKDIRMKKAEFVGEMENYLHSGEQVYRYHYILRGPKGSDFSSMVNELSANRNIIQIFETDDAGKSHGEN